METGKGLHIDPKSGVPMYLQIKDHFKSLIANRTLAPGAQLPTIRELCEFNH